MTTQHAQPIFVDPTGNARVLSRADGGDVPERLIKELVLKHPAVLPIGEIDEAFSEPIAICDELRTLAGPIDAFLINRFGLPILVECKLYRNPEARRKVVAQILDYSKELHRWSYSDLQREVSNRCGGKALIDMVRDRSPELDEARFIDSVTRSLRTGRFLLLIVGDGIREDVEELANMMQSAAGRHFALGLIEMPVFETVGGGRLVTPRVLARTRIIDRFVVDLKSDKMEVAEEPDEDFDAQNGPRRWHFEFWTDLFKKLKLDDPDQQLPNITNKDRMRFSIPVSGRQACWINLYRSKSERLVGLFLTSLSDGLGKEIMQRLVDDPDRWRKQVPNAKITTSTSALGGKRIFIIEENPYSGELEPNSAEREHALCWLANKANQYVNIFRPLVTEIGEEIS